MNSLSDGVKRYSASWFRLDQLYRKFIYHMQKSGQSGLLSALYEAVENRYTTNFVLKLNDAWQDQVARLTDWAVPGFPRQVDFYRGRLLNTGARIKRSLSSSRMRCAMRWPKRRCARSASSIGSMLN